MPADIARWLFVELFKMQQYPGSPFTGNPVYDLVMFFFIPTVFIIFFIYLTLAWLVAPEHKGIRMLMGIAIYLFIVVGGWYGTFALIAGQYFFILIFVLGALFFFRRHVRVTPLPIDVGKMKYYLGLKELPGPRRKWLEAQYRNLNRNIAEQLKTGKPIEQTGEWMVLRDEIEKKLFARVLSEEERKKYM